MRVESCFHHTNLAEEAGSKQSRAAYCTSELFSRAAPHLGHGQEAHRKSEQEAGMLFRRVAF
ncbi:hypothetical protein AAIG85_34830, partial [Pseudomonas aeruginosa]|uniref:hypothetical protein n=1 Tax=Pseudomonas aeruginosa TaxID=287 RepID=UPI0031B71F40